MKVQGLSFELGRCLLCDKFNKEDRTKNCYILNSFIEFCKRNKVKAEITECAGFKPKNVQKTEFEKLENELLGKEE